MDLALNILQRLICHKNPTNQPVTRKLEETRDYTNSPEKPSTHKCWGE